MNLASSVTPPDGFTQKESVESNSVYLKEGCGKTHAKINDTQYPTLKTDMKYRGKRCPHRIVHNENECCPSSFRIWKLPHFLLRMSENTFNIYVLIAQRHKVRNYFRKTGNTLNGIEYRTALYAISWYLTQICRLRLANFLNIYRDDTKDDTKNRREPLLIPGDFRVSVARAF